MLHVYSYLISASELAYLYWIRRLATPRRIGAMAVLPFDVSNTHRRPSTPLVLTAVTASRVPLYGRTFVIVFLSLIHI